MTTAAGADAWIETWLSQPRFAVYLEAAGGDRGKAVALYEWNSSVASAFHHDLAHVEVGLRNAYDRALCQATPAGGRHWVFEPERFFPPQRHKAANGRFYDANEKSRNLIAELGFGFWRYLSSRRQHDPLWVPYLHAAFRPGTDRRAVDRPVGRLHNLRNRVAHHEPLFAINLAASHGDLVALADLISPKVAAYVAENSLWPRLSGIRPVSPLG